MNGKAEMVLKSAEVTFADANFRWKSCIPKNKGRIEGPGLPVLGRVPGDLISPPFWWERTEQVRHM